MSKSIEQVTESLRRHCTRAERSESDVRRLLYRWEVAREEWDRIMETLRGDKFVDNERYASAYTREKSRLSGWGAAKIAANLKAKNIDKEIIKRAIEENIDPAQSRETLAKFIRQATEKNRSKAKNDYDLRARVFRAAAAKGFDFDEINSQLNEIILDV